MRRRATQSAFKHGGATTRRNLFFVQVAVACTVAGGCPGVDPAELLLGDPEAPVDPSIELLNGVTYRKIEGQELKLDVYRPTGSSATPVVIMVHGGGWRTVYPDYQALESWGEYFASHGITAVNIRYRLAPKYRFPDALLDVVAAIRWVRSNSDWLHIDAQRIVLFGNSAGAHLALLAALCGAPDSLGDAGDPEIDPSVQGVIECAGPTDMVQLYDYLRSSCPVPGFELCVPQCLGGSPKSAPEQYDLASPINYVGPGKPKMLIVHADTDEIVPYEQSAALASALSAAGDDVQLLTVPGASHAVYLHLSDARVQQQILPQIDAFLQEAFLVEDGSTDRDFAGDSSRPARSPGATRTPSLVPLGPDDQQGTTTLDVFDSALRQSY